MSDFILKFWTKENHLEDQTELIEKQFKEDKIISQETKHWGKAAYTSGANFGEMIGVENEVYLSELRIQIQENGYGVEEGEEDFEFVDRKNVIAVYNGDGEIDNWTKFEQYLSEITGKIYTGGWELL